MWKPLEPVARPARIALGVAFFALFFLGWAAVTFGGLIPDMFLKDPAYTFVTGYGLFAEYGFLYDVAITIYRVVGGFLIAAIVGVPIGILMGAYKPIEALLEPFVSFARYIPASAFIPLLILWAGVGEAQKLSLIVIGSLFQIILMVAVIVGATRRDLVEAAYTLGATPAGVVRRVILPAAAPQIAETLRLVLGWAWTYVIVAELVGADRGIGHMIMDSQRLLDTGQMIFGMFLIGLIGLVSDFLFKLANAKLYPWSLA
jgi:NitT/TauT family transport system permease protein